MGDNMAEADEFDRVIQSVSDGSYRPSPAAGMETFPAVSYSCMHGLWEQCDRNHFVVKYLSKKFFFINCADKKCIIGLLV